MKRLIGGSLVLLMLWSSGVLATPSVYGPTGLVTMPTAEGLTYKQFNTGLNYVPPYLKGEEDDNGDIEGKDYHGIISYYGNLGTFEGMEFGFQGRGGQEGV
ncbi:MAG: YjbH domain-containing protein, partial [Candidatus Margulisbacteria bacterium]|nr:YjbH domain-containing protein [Candidatus Margulisiibacteriota bacterium]